MNEETHTFSITTMAENLRFAPSTAEKAKDSIAPPASEGSSCTHSLALVQAAMRCGWQALREGTTPTPDALDFSPK